MTDSRDAAKREYAQVQTEYLEAKTKLDELERMIEKDKRLQNEEKIKAEKTIERLNNASEHLAKELSEVKLKEK